MGVGVSGWQLARCVSQRGQLGVVSGTGLACLIHRKMQEGDLGGHIRRAVDQFPFPDVGERVWKRYFIPGGRPEGQPFSLSPMPMIACARALVELTVVANFVEVWLAKEGHHGAIGINYLEKIQTPTLPQLYGAILANVDCVLMGAGIPRYIPGALDNLSAGKPASLKIDVEGALPTDDYASHFDPADFSSIPPSVRPRPRFFAIISSAVLALTLARKSNGRVDGFIVEGPTAGGHNAPPRGPLQLTHRGEPVYGERDVPDLEKIRDLGLPFWLAGGFGTPDHLAQALAKGASGIQVGTAFAFSDESGITAELKRTIIDMALAGEAEVLTDAVASPTGFPFKVLQLDTSISNPTVYQKRKRICDLGYLRKAYRKDDGSVGYRCAAEPVEQFVAKGGKEADTVGRKCLCNSLFAVIGLSQVTTDGTREPAILTSGDDVSQLARYLKPGQLNYSAIEVLEYLLAPVAAAVV